jgi:hypothetical protein
MLAAGGAVTSLRIPDWQGLLGIPRIRWQLIRRIPMRGWGRGRIVRIIPLLGSVSLSNYTVRLIAATGKKSIDVTTAAGDLDGTYVEREAHAADNLKP